MTPLVHFTKMHGAGNDYIYVDTTRYPIANPAEAARQWSAPHTGIGADGLVLIGEARMPEADFSMRIFNADGSEAMMCGNASRCIGKYLYEKGLTQKTEIRLLTLSGIKVLKLVVNGGKVESVTVDMLEPMLHNKAQFIGSGIIGKETTLGADDREFHGTFVSMGNPHFVIFVDDITNTKVEKYGPLLEYNPVFPERCNIEFAQLLAPAEDDGRGASIRMRVWERGSGVTMACGTGACATAVAAAVTGRTGRRSTVVMDGGSLGIEWRERDNHVYMTGPATFVFEGDIKLQTT